MPHALKILVAILAVPSLAAIASWELGAYLCNHALVGKRSFDFVCGHNALNQLLPSFISFLVIFSLLAGRILRTTKQRRNSL